jgi:hypothetical protein
MLGLLHAGGLRGLLRDTDPGDHDVLVRRFHGWTIAALQPHSAPPAGTSSTAWPNSTPTVCVYQTDDLKWALCLA